MQILCGFFEKLFFINRALSLVKIYKKIDESCLFSEIKISKELIKNSFCINDLEKRTLVSINSNDSQNILSVYFGVLFALERIFKKLELLNK